MKWDDPKYKRITGAEVIGNNLSVVFANGEQVNVAVEYVLPESAIGVAYKVVDFSTRDVSIDTVDGVKEIPWTTFRLLTDPEFSAFWADAAEAEAKRVGSRLRSLRLRRGLSSKEVAERAGISAQSLSRIELGRHDIVFTTLQRVLAAMGYTLKDLAEAEDGSPTLNVVLRHLESVGVRREWVLDRFLPESIRKLAKSATATKTATGLVESIAEVVGSIFGWSPDQILTLQPLTVDSSIAGEARFKGVGSVDSLQATTYAAYAHFLSAVIADASRNVGITHQPKSPEEIREIVESRFSFVDFESLVKYVWSLGIPVVPLRDSGSFHGACWVIEGRPVIVLKQASQFQGRWLFDLAHELAHVLLHLSPSAPVHIESELINPLSGSSGDRRDKEEEEANSFASGLLFQGRPEDLAQKCVTYAKGEVKFLKSAVSRVAQAENVQPDLLANYMAFRLNATNNVNWWGTARSFQITEPAPFDIAKRELLKNTNLAKLTDEQRELIHNALT